MSTRRLIIVMIFSSFVGGVFAIIGFSFLSPKETIIRSINPESNPVNLTNYVADSTDISIPAGLNFVLAAKKTTNSVVHIRTAYNTGMKTDSFFDDYFGNRGNQRGAGASGSGVIISSDGYIVTNNHVIDDADEIEVVLNDNRSYQAKVVGVHENTDLAVLKIDEDDLLAVEYGNSDQINIGEWVLAIGNPYEFRSTVTAGIVSAKGRNINILDGSYKIESFIQTDAIVNPGNSGGALVNLKGELIGINTAKASSVGYSFAVPVSLVKKVVSDLIEYGTVQRALLGISIYDVNAQVAERNNLSVLTGVYVNGVMKGKAADKAGIKQGDVIVAIDNMPVNTVAQLQEQVAVKRPGDKVAVMLIREGKEKTVMAKLRNKKGTLEVVDRSSEYRIEGATFEDVSDQLRDQLGIDGGVQITKLDQGKWANVRMKRGFIITGIDNEKIKNIRDLENYFKSIKTDAMLIEGIYPDGSRAHYGLGM